MNKDPKSLLTSFVIEVWNNNNPSLVQQFIDPKYTIHLLGQQKDFSGINWVISNIKNSHTKYKNLHIEILDTVVENDKIASRLILTSKINNKTQTSREFIIHRIKDGKFIEAWSLGSNWS